MILNKLTHCLNDFNFQPNSQWPQVLPGISFNGRVVAGFSQEDQLGHFLPNLEERTQAFQQLYPRLQLGEFSRLIEKCQRVPDFLNTLDLAKFYGWNLNDNLAKLLKVLAQTPLAFQLWVDQKSVGPAEMAPLRRLKSSLDLTPQLLSLASSPLSKQEGLKYLELLIDLTEMHAGNTQLQEALPMASPDGLKKLETLRFKNSEEFNQKFSTPTEKISWPLHSQARWLRRGDRTGIELKLFWGSPQEMQKSLPQLERALADWTAGL